MQVAEGFCAREGIGKSSLQQIMKFITDNSGGGTTVGYGSAPPGGAAAAPKPSAPATPSRSMFPLTSPLQFKDGKYDPLQKKILEFNGQVLDTLKMEALDLQYFNDTVEKL